MGYPNPEAIPLKENVTFRGICVYVPDAPEYLRALLGSLAGLGSWVVWERDDQQSAARSAELWRLANDRTIETWSEPCGCDDMNCDDIRDIIREELENMTITITNTNTNCCCCGSCGTCNDSPPVTSPPPPGVDNPPLPTIPPDEDTPPPDVTETADYRQFSCNMSHYMFYLIRSAIIEIRASWERNHMLSVMAFLPGRIDAGPFVRPGGAPAAPWSYLEWLVVAKSQEDMVDLVRQMDIAYDNLVCALSGSFTASIRRERFLAVVDAMAISENQRRWVRLAVSGIEFHSWFNPVDIYAVQELLPPTYQDRDCPCTGTGLPAWPDGYYLAAAADDEWDFTPNNASASTTYNAIDAEFTHLSLNANLNYHEVDVEILVDDVVTRTGGQSAHGYIFEAITEGGTPAQIRVPTPAGGGENVGIVAGESFILYQGDEYANVPAYAAYVDALQWSQRFNYGNGPQTNSVKNLWRSQTYTEALTSFKYRVRVICKES